MTPSHHTPGESVKIPRLSRFPRGASLAKPMETVYSVGANDEKHIEQDGMTE